MGLKDILLGSKANYKLLPGLQPLIDEASTSWEGPGKPAKAALKGLDYLRSGQDISGLGYTAPLFQEEARDLSEIDFEAGTGASQLAAMFGGSEQGNLQQQLINRAKERRREQTGRQLTSLIPELNRSLTDTVERGYQRQNDVNYRNRALAGQLITGGMYDPNKRSGGILPGLIQGGAMLGSAYLGR